MNKDIYLTNSLGGKKEIFKPIDPKKSKNVCMRTNGL